ncbi:MAG: cytochrome P450 [Dehalococcoidia bacterium]
MLTVEYNPFDPQVHANPHPIYHRLRAEEPVHWSEILDAWVLTRYHDVVAVLTDRRFSADRRQAQNRLVQEALKIQEQFRPFDRAATMLNSDPPEHTRLRRLVSRAFTPRMVESRRPHIQEIVDGLLDSLQESGRLDVIRDLAYPLPVIVIAEMLGVPPQDRGHFKRWSDDIVAALGGPLLPAEVLEKARRGVQEMADYLRNVIDQRRWDPAEDLLSALTAAEEQGQVLSEDELLATCVLLLVAGNETTTDLIGNGMLALVDNPDQMQKLRNDPSLIESAVEELLRYDGPAQMTSRVAMADVKIGGREVKKGQLVFAVLAAANRDPAQFSNPDELDIGRRDNPHVAFGEGTHFCLGAPLARAEGQIAIATLLRRIPHMRLDSDKMEWGGSFILRGLNSLPVAF